MEKFEEPYSEWLHEAAYDTLAFYLPGYGKEKLKLQVTSTMRLRISGERQGGENEVIRFRQEFPIPAVYDTDRISGSFKGGILYVKFPKLIRSMKGKANQVDQEQATQQVPRKKDTDKQTTEQIEEKKPQKHEDVQQNQKKDQDHVADKEVPPRTNMETPKNEKTGDGVAKTSNDVASKAAEKEKEMNDRNGKTNDKPKEKEQGQGGVIGMVKEKCEHQLRVTQQVLGVLVTEIRNPRRVMNLVLAMLLVVVLGLYARNAFRFLLGGSDSED